jgi:hypothetical protein
MNLSSTIKSIQDIMRKDDGVDGDAQRLGQLTWMLFLKVFDQREEEWEDDAKDQGKTYKSPLPERFRWRNWAKYLPDAEGKKKPQIAGSELIGFVNNELFPALKEQIDPSQSPSHKVIKQIFEDANNFMKSGPQMLAVIEKLEEAINFHDFKTRASLGDVYEQMLNDLRGAGNAGEFYTPRAITAFMVDRVDPNLERRESVLDPACGTGGFLTATIDHFRKQRTTKSGTEDQRAIEKLIQGIEKKQLPHLLCTTNMLLHGIDVPSQIEHRNTLGRPWNDWGGARKGRLPNHQPSFWRLRRRRCGQRLPGRPQNPRNRRHVHGADHQEAAQGERPRRSGPARRFSLWRRHQRYLEKAAAARMQAAHHRPPAQRGVRPLHHHQDQPVVLHQRRGDGRRQRAFPHRHHLVLRTPLSGGLQELLQNQADPPGRVQARTGVVGLRGQRLCRPGGKRIRLEGRFQGQA